MNYNRVNRTRYDVLYSFVDFYVTYNITRLLNLGEIYTMLLGGEPLF